MKGSCPIFVNAQPSILENWIFYYYIVTAGVNGANARVFNLNLRRLQFEVYLNGIKRN